MFGLYITHPQVRIDPDMPVPKWGLSDVGRARAETLAGKAWVRRIGRIVTSDETKAIELADILAAAAGAPVETVHGAHENDRSATGFLPPAEFEKAADWFFAHPEESFRGWERAIDAQRRIVAVVRDVLASHDPSVPIAFIGHGGVGTLLRCHLAGLPIDRIQDQPPNGGGNIHIFGLDDLKPAGSGWMPMEDFEPPSAD
ncbi:MAG: phosphoglycerate mutase family protein [Rhizobium sp.]|nr:phosphoglycerate mutase family protein [Rhizobium sp.]